MFRRFFLGGRDPVRDLLKLKQPDRTRAEGVLQIPATDPGDDLQEQVSLGLMASDAETLRRKSFPACTPDELAALRRIMARIRLTPPGGAPAGPCPRPRAVPGPARDGA